MSLFGDVSNLLKSELSGAMRKIFVEPRIIDTVVNLDEAYETPQM